MTGVEFTEPDPYGTPDAFVPAGERWECPCGYFTSGPATATFSGVSVQAKCPHCGTLVEHEPEIR